MKIKFLLYIIPIFFVACSNGGNASQEETEGESQEQEVVENADADLDTELEVAETAVFFTNLTEGSEVKNPITIEMGVKGMTLEPKGPINDNAGHHHLIIDGAFVPSGQIVPTSETSIHYGGGQSTGTINLAPGKHILTLQFADGAHASYGENMSSTISVNVVDVGPAPVSE